MVKNLNFPIKRYEIIKVIDGRKFRLMEHNPRKQDAERTRDSLRHIGNLARIIKTKWGYEVWAHKKTAQPRRPR